MTREEWQREYERLRDELVLFAEMYGYNEGCHHKEDVAATRNELDAHVATLPASWVPSVETARLAPAAVCRVASWIVRLRKLADNDPDLKAKIGYLLGPIPFEKELLSGRMEEIERAIQEIGRT